MVLEQHQISNKPYSLLWREYWDRHSPSSVYSARGRRHSGRWSGRIRFSRNWKFLKFGDIRRDRRKVGEWAGYGRRATFVVFGQCRPRYLGDRRIKWKKPAEDLRNLLGRRENFYVGPGIERRTVWTSSSRDAEENLRGRRANCRIHFISRQE